MSDEKKNQEPKQEEQKQNKPDEVEKTPEKAQPAKENTPAANGTAVPVVEEAKKVGQTEAGKNTPSEDPANASAKKEPDKPAQGKTEETPKKKERPKECVVCSKSIKKKWYYRENNYYCGKGCWEKAKKEAREKANSAKEGEASQKKSS
ncbi:MAG: hypothetical protein JW994_05680 [Candidatus Omnitrophica bacterium]|nr:hypothetical protein [Candidatus Omnitrophota bacterium]